MIVPLIFICWLLLSVMSLTLVWPFLKVAKRADEVAEEYWGEVEHFDKRV